MFSHVSTSRNSLYTDIPRPHYLTQNSFYPHSVEQIYKEIQEHTSPVADTARIVQNRKSHLRLQTRKNPKQDTTLSIAVNPHPRPVPIHNEAAYTHRHNKAKVKAIEISSSKQYTLLSWYKTPKAKKIQPDDGLKRAETRSCITYCTIQCNKVYCVWTVSCTYCIVGSQFATSAVRGVHIFRLWRSYPQINTFLFMNGNNEVYQASVKSTNPNHKPFILAPAIDSRLTL